MRATDGRHEVLWMAVEKVLLKEEKMNDEQWKRISKTMNQAVTPMFDKFAKDYFAHIQPQLDKILNQSLLSLQPTFEKIAEKIDIILAAAEAAATTIAPLLEKSNLWITPSMPYSLILDVKELASNEETSVEMVEEVFLKYFEKNNWEMLQAMIESWKVYPFAQRKHIIHDAFDAHKSGKYTLSIPALLPQTEGILSSIYGKEAGRPYKLFDETIQQEYPDVLNNIAKDILLKFVTSLYKGIKPEHFTTDKLPLWLESEGIKEIDFMNRHAILHGIHVNYASKINSLRVFLLLDSLYSLADNENLTPDT